MQIRSGKIYGTTRTDWNLLFLRPGFSCTRFFFFLPRQSTVRFLSLLCCYFLIPNIIISPKKRFFFSFVCTLVHIWKMAWAEIIKAISAHNVAYSVICFLTDGVTIQWLHLIMCSFFCSIVLLLCCCMYVINDGFLITDMKKMIKM